jgi:hypothetical protein
VASPRDRDKVGLCSAEARKASRALAFDQRGQRFADENRLFLRARQALRLGDELVIQRYGRPHLPASESMGTVWDIK